VRGYRRRGARTFGSGGFRRAMPVSMPTGHTVNRAQQGRPLQAVGPPHARHVLQVLAGPDRERVDPPLSCNAPSQSRQQIRLQVSSNRPPASRRAKIAMFLLTSEISTKIRWEPLRACNAQLIRRDMWAAPSVPSGHRACVRKVPPKGQTPPRTSTSAHAHAHARART
jgi:hypothetical protein